MKVSLVRHAQPVVDPKVLPRDWPLSALGVESAGRLAGDPRWSELSQVVTSSELKAIQTGEALAKTTGAKLEVCSDLDEVRRGRYISGYEATVERFFDEPSESADGWETAEHALSRARCALSLWVGTDPEGHVALVGHGLMLTILHAWLLNRPKADYEDWRRILMPGVSTWEVREDGVQLIADFEGTHLARY